MGRDSESIPAFASPDTFPSSVQSTTTLSLTTMIDVGIALMQKPPRESIPICPACFNFQEDLFPHKEEASFSYNPDGFGQLLLEVEFSYQDVKAQAQQADCDSCRVLFEGIRSHWLWVGDPDGLKVSFQKDGPALVEATLGGLTEEDRRTVRLWMFTASGATTPWKLVGSISTIAPKSVLTVDRLSTFKGWLQNCTDNHQDCRLSTPGVLPKRLVGIGPRDNLFLAEDVEPGARYVALSHSWASSMPQGIDTRLLESNITQRRYKMEWDMLSTTFRESLYIAMSFGIRYVWIDSLCIIQDSPDDWAEQAAQMANIYENAYFTIACEFSPGGTPEDGCFLGRRSIQEFPAWNLEGLQFSVFVQADYSHAHETEGLSSRGWCAQEKFLSRRMLRFRENDVLFECAQGRSCECETLGINLWDLHTSRGMHPGQSNPVAGIIRHRESDKIKDTLEMRIDYELAWKTAVFNFSMASLTQVTDRLPAMSGMASRMPRELFGDYIAGLWSRELLNQLCWTPRQKTIPLPRRYEEWVGPSFSWVSVQANCEWNNDWRGDNDRDAEIIDARVKAATVDPLGKVESASVHLRTRITKTRKGIYEGRAKPVRFIPRSSIARLSPREDWDEDDYQRDPYRFDTEEDSEAYESGRCTVFALEISYGFIGSRALLVKESERSRGSLERVGFVVFENMDFFEGVEPEEVTLV